MIGALVEMYKTSYKESYIILADKIAKAAINNSTNVTGAPNVNGPFQSGAKTGPETLKYGGPSRNVILQFDIGSLSHMLY
jgi:hypothetical protein